MHNLDPRIAAAATAQRQSNLVLLADQKGAFEVGIGFQSQLDASDDDIAPVVAPHDINRYSHTRYDNGKRVCFVRSRARCLIEPKLGQRLAQSLDRYDWAPIIIPAGRTYPVRHIGCGTLRTGAQLRQFEHAVVSAPLTLTAVRRFAFRYAHK